MKNKFTCDDLNMLERGLVCLHLTNGEDVASLLGKVEIIKIDVLKENFE